MNLVVSGMLNKQIAAELGASEATVKMHRSQVMKKMQAKSLPELVRMRTSSSPYWDETDCPAMDIPLTKLSKVGV
jgi:Bacterial regulatory proteins, luxR family